MTDDSLLRLRCEALKAELLLLRVVERLGWPSSAGNESTTPAWAHEPLREAQDYLDGVAATVSGARSATTLVVVGDPPSAIAEAARTPGAHLIAMATRGRGGLVRHLLGSVATPTLQQASVPVLLARPTTADEQARRTAGLRQTIGRTRPAPARDTAFMRRSRQFSGCFSAAPYSQHVEDIRKVQPTSASIPSRARFPGKSVALCATCEIEVPWTPVWRLGEPFCCKGCSVGGPCCCSYD